MEIAMSGAVDALDLLGGFEQVRPYVSSFNKM